MNKHNPDLLRDCKELNFVSLKSKQDAELKKTESYITRLIISVTTLSVLLVTFVVVISVIANK